MLQRFSVAYSLNELLHDGFHVVFEAATEVLDVKQQIFHDVSALLMQKGVSPCEVILCSNTVHLPLSLITAYVDKAHKCRCVGFRFLEPVLFVDDIIVKCEHDEVALEKTLLAPLDLKLHSASDLPTSHVPACASACENVCHSI